MFVRKHEIKISTNKCPFHPNRKVRAYITIDNIVIQSEIRDYMPLFSVENKHFKQTV